MTEGKAMFLMLLFFLIGAVIGEIMYRYKRRKLRKDHFSDHGIKLVICRSEYYIKGTMILFSVTLGVLFLAYMIHVWDKPL